MKVSFLTLGIRPRGQHWQSQARSARRSALRIAGILFIHPSSVWNKICYRSPFVPSPWSWAIWFVSTFASDTILQLAGLTCVNSMRDDPLCLRLSFPYISWALPIMFWRLQPAVQPDPKGLLPPQLHITNLLRQTCSHPGSEVAKTERTTCSIMHLIPRSVL